MTWYKFLATGAVGPFSGYRWPRPSGHEPGGWVMAEDGLDPCRSGLHICRSADLPFWVSEELYVVEVDGPVTEYESFVLANRARLVRGSAWGRRVAGSFSRACAWRVRDLAAEALVRTGRREEADQLLACASLGALEATVGRLAERDIASTSAVTGYVQDVLSFTGGAERTSGWASATATTAFVAAAAARATAQEDSGTAAWAAERRRQASWMAELAGR